MILLNFSYFFHLSFVFFLSYLYFFSFPDFSSCYSFFRTFLSSSYSPLFHNAVFLFAAFHLKCNSYPRHVSGKTFSFNKHRAQTQTQIFRQIRYFNTNFRSFYKLFFPPFFEFLCLLRVLRPLLLLNCSFFFYRQDEVLFLHYRTLLLIGLSFFYSFLFTLLYFFLLLQFFFSLPLLILSIIGYFFYVYVLFLLFFSILSFFSNFHCSIVFPLSIPPLSFCANFLSFFFF